MSTADRTYLPVVIFVRNGIIHDADSDIRTKENVPGIELAMDYVP